MDSSNIHFPNGHKRAFDLFVSGWTRISFSMDEETYNFEKVVKDNDIDDLVCKLKIQFLVGLGEM